MAEEYLFDMLFHLPYKTDNERICKFIEMIKNKYIFDGHILDVGIAIKILKNEANKRWHNLSSDTQEQVLMLLLDK